MEEHIIRVEEEDLDNFCDELVDEFDLWYSKECIDLLNKRSKIEILKLIELAREDPETCDQDLLFQILSIPFSNLQAYKKEVRKMFLENFKSNKKDRELYNMEVEKQKQLIVLIKAAQSQVEHFDLHVQKICDAIVEGNTPRKTSKEQPALGETNEDQTTSEIANVIDYDKLKYQKLAGEFLLKSRKVARLRQPDVVAVLGHTRSWVGDIENGRNMTSLFEFHKLCNVYGVTLKDWENFILEKPINFDVTPLGKDLQPLCEAETEYYENKNKELIRPDKASFQQNLASFLRVSREKCGLSRDKVAALGLPQNPLLSDTAFQRTPRSRAASVQYRQYFHTSVRNQDSVCQVWQSVYRYHSDSISQKSSDISFRGYHIDVCHRKHMHRRDI